MLALELIAGTESGCDRWDDFFKTEKPPMDHSKESMFDYRRRIDRIAKHKAITIVGEILLKAAN